jgi:hypothetical protein
MDAATLLPPWQGSSARAEGSGPARSGRPKQQSALQVATGTVVDGKIVLEGVPLTEGAKVTVVSRGAEESLALSEAQEDALLDSLAEIERGECASLEEVVASLPARR